MTEFPKMLYRSEAEHSIADTKDDEARLRADGFGDFCALASVAEKVRAELAARGVAIDTPAPQQARKRGKAPQ